MARKGPARQWHAAYYTPAEPSKRWRGYRAFYQSAVKEASFVDRAGAIWFTTRENGRREYDPNSGRWFIFFGRHRPTIHQFELYDSDEER